MCADRRSRSRSRRGSRSHSGDLAAKLKELKSRVRALPPGGDLESLIHQGAEEMKALLFEELVGERRKEAASSEADFPPSDVP
jgi:hypothetical protein